MAKKVGSASKGRTRTVVRSAKTGRFLKSSAAKRRPDVSLKETVEIGSGTEVELARSAKTGRFVKKTTAKHNPKKTIVKRVRR
jgi:hypothetical protein